MAWFWILSVGIGLWHSWRIEAQTEWIQISRIGEWQRVSTPETGSSDCLAVAWMGHHVCVADANDGLQVIDVRDGSAPVRVGGLATGGLAWDLVVKDSLVYLADAALGLVVIELANPADPRRVGGHAAGGGVLGVAVEGAHAYLASGRSGLQVFDITDPAHPERIGGVDAIGSLGLAAAGDRLCVAAQNRGIQIHQFTELPAFIRRFVRDGLLDLSWNQAATGMMVQQAPWIGTGLWEDVAGSPGTNPLSQPAESGAGFFRLKTSAPRRPSERGDSERWGVD